MVQFGFEKSLKIFLLFFLLPAPLAFADVNEVRPLFKHKPQLIFSENMEGVKKLSGVAWLPEENHYLFSSANPPALHEMAVLSGRVRKIRTVKLKEFKDVSAVAYVGRAESGDEGNRIAISEEGKAEVSFCDLSGAQGELKRSKCKTYKIDRLMFWEKKFGIKGVAVNRDSDVPVFYFGKEKLPKEIYRGFFEDGQWHIQKGWDAESMMPPESVISDLFYDNSLFVLDGWGARVLQMDPVTGQTVSEFHVKKENKAGLSGFCLARGEEGLQAALASSKSRYFIYNIPVSSEALKEKESL